MANRVYSVAQVNAYIKNMFSQDYVLNHIMIRGEVSNCKYHTSGHIYFTLKDQEADRKNNTEKTTGSWSAIACVMFAGYRAKLPFKLEDGQRVIVEGTVNVYERDGKYQIYASNVTLDGIGLLYQEFEKTKQELYEMGMFDPMYKKPIPAHATRIGVVTAKTGAAIQDIISIAKRRNPHVEIYLYPALVQGEGAVESIIRGIKTLDTMQLDVMIIGRGGGSIEDLWAFNSKEMAYAIFEAQTPIISAVGHQTDVTISDYVADLRAATPSAACELAVFDYIEFENTLIGYREDLDRLYQKKINETKLKLQSITNQFLALSPQKKLEQKKANLALLQSECNHLMKQKVMNAYQKLENIKNRFDLEINNQLTIKKHKLALLANALDTSSPLKRISGGYTFVLDENNKPLSKVMDLTPGLDVTIYLVDGKAKAQIKEVTEEVTIK